MLHILVHNANFAAEGIRERSQIPMLNKPGRRRKACDSCAKNRIVCNGGLSCHSCRSRGTHCSYTRLEAHPSSPSDSRPDTCRVSTRSQANRNGDNEPEFPTPKISVPFLLNYSATSNRHPGEVNNVLTALATAESKDKTRDPAVPSLLLENDRPDLFFEESWNLFLGSHEDQARCETPFLPRGLEDDNECKSAASRVLQSITSRHADASQDALYDRAKKFLTKENIHDFVVAYFDGTVRPRSRIVLKSFFDLSSTSTPLLLAMLLMGAICAGSKDAKCNAIEYANKAEVIVFDDPSFQRLVYQKRESRLDMLGKSDIEIIQAAILMILIQISSPDSESRRRIRIHRYPALVSVARATGLTQIKNIWHDSAIFSHEVFLGNELSIRMMASIAMIDTHFIMFFNSPPLLSPFELGFDLPAEDAGVDISDTSTWEEWVTNQRKYQRPPPLNQFIQELLSDNWAGKEDTSFQNLNVFALFIVISSTTLNFTHKQDLYDLKLTA
ncbi:hypothetical protein N7481_000229 [Penicillium waksmanii]|uniref:uncharacterized protein n=1 Tax=Penicillium waksmanii TaxID=69791 RepID=UPI00254768D7|nr:uncharacterized protein N7481_000229 [Penicillium waksmanii]KAJ5999820.1 hypothetical protein N7481_000229 [Penicillium waksmanii]